MDALEYKPDWKETKQRYAAWWRGEKMDRCLLAVQAPLDGLPDEPPPKRPDTIEKRWTDLDYLSACNDYCHRRTFFGAEAFPIWVPGHPGHVSIPTFYGCPVTLDWDTAWHEHILTGERLDISGLKLDRRCKWWEFGVEVLKHARAAAKGKSIPAIGAIFGGGDTLAALRGTERLMLDMMDDPAGVRDAELKLMDDWFEVFRHQVDLVKDEEDWYATWFGIWAPGLFYPVQCDVSYGISPRTFRECFVPALRKQAGFLDYSVYHMDGVGAFPLIEEICRIEGVGAVQVGPGAGKPSPIHYLDVCRTIQRSGKRLHITIPASEVPQALSVLGSRGLCIETWAQSESEARKVIEQAQTLSRF